MNSNLQLPSMPHLYLHFKVISENGTILKDYFEEAHSWTRNAWNAWNAMMLDCGAVGTTYAEGSLTAREKTYGSITINPDITFNRSAATILASGFCNSTTSVDYGIIVGTSNIPMYSEDYDLYGLIPLGTGTGQLSYSAQVAPITTYDNISKKWTTTHLRVINNNSPAEIIIREIGLVYAGTANLAAYSLMARDVLSIPIVLPVGSQLTVSYIITTMAFTVCENTGAPSFPALGSFGSGGIYAGTVSVWGGGQGGAVVTQNPGPYGGGLYMLICSLIEGESGALQLKNAATSPPSASDCNNTGYGGLITLPLIALGALSEAGTFCSTKNAAGMGGYDDWYIPTVNESVTLNANQAYITGVNALTDTWYWTSYIYDVGYAVVLNLVNWNSANLLITEAHTIRLVRRIHISQWVPD